MTSINRFSSFMANIFKIFLMIGNENAVCIPAIASGKKKTVMTCELMLCRTSFLVIPTFIKIENLP